MFFNVVLCYFLLIEQLFPKRLFSKFGKHDAQLTFDDSYNSYVSKIDVFCIDVQRNNFSLRNFSVGFVH